MAIFRKKPWVNPFGKMSKMPKKKKFDKWPFWDQNHGLTPLEKCQFLLLFKTSCFYSLKRRVHVLEYHKRHFPGLYCLKKTSLINGNFS